MFNTRLKIARLENGMTQEVVARTLGISLNSYQKYEGGTREPRLDMLVRLARLFNVPTDYLLGLSGEEPSDGSRISPP